MCLLCWPAASPAQQPDSLAVFGPQDLLEYVETYHPLARQAGLLSEQGRQAVRAARGAFDPELKSNLDQKRFEGKNYYRSLQAGMRIPTSYGMSFKAAYEQNSGVFLNPENRLPDAGLWTAGVSVPLGQGLLFDERRLAVQQARVMARATEAERVRMLNDLFYDALKTYWQWVMAWEQTQIYEQAVELAGIRFEGIKASFLQGDKPAIDTLEAYMLLQNRQLSYNESLLALQHERLRLSNFLWNAEGLPLQLPLEAGPPSRVANEGPELMGEEQLALLMQQLTANHPELRLYEYKITDLQLQGRWKREKLKPKLMLEYNLLSHAAGEFAGSFSTNNYKWGFAFSFPLFLRTARAELELNRLKLQQAGLGREQKQLEITNKVMAYYNQLQTLRQQLDLYTDVAQNYRRLFEAEVEKFRLGESSVFLLNSRELKYIEA
ncbi:MAG: TolC family protein, partial [Bacteroidetes bacterium]